LEGGKRERERKSNIRDGVFESSPSRSVFLVFLLD
jgi:hypothetical protein